MSLNSRLYALDQIPNRTPAQQAERTALLEMVEDHNCSLNPRLIECLDDGFVRLVDHMGDDNAVVRAARVSYGKGTKSVSDDRGLIRYLMRHRHTTPFEMVEFVFHVRCPMDCFRQWVRHRTASINEYSTRYSEAIDSAQEATEWRLQSKGNKQGSGGLVETWPDGYRIEPAHFDEGMYVVLDPEGHPRMLTPEVEYTAGQYLSARENEVQMRCRHLYEERLKFGVAREQARKDLPLSTYTEAYWKCDLHNLLHFLTLRMDSHAQQEIREYANAIATIIKPIVPWTWEAFEDFRLDALTLSGPEAAAIKFLLHAHGSLLKMSRRELDELKPKLERLGVGTDRFQELVNEVLAV